MNSEDFEFLLFDQEKSNQRFTQDSPVYPEVWIQYYKLAGDATSNMRVDVILSPHRDYSAAKLLLELRTQLHKHETQNLQKGIVREETNPWRLAISGETVVCQVSFPELITVALPMTEWWQSYLNGHKTSSKTRIDWLQNVVESILKRMKQVGHQDYSIKYENLILQKIKSLPHEESNTKSTAKTLPRVIWAVNLNRSASISLYKSVATTKGDASIRLFNVDGAGITWAIFDTGIDANHIAFRKKGANQKPLPKAMVKEGSGYKNNSRIIATYDFTSFRDLLANLNDAILTPDSAEKEKKGLFHLIRNSSDDTNKPLSRKQILDFITETEKDLERGMMIEWQKLEPILRIPHHPDHYIVPENPHGTHVAGIIGANWPKGDGDQDIIGMCPGIELYDIRVLNKDGLGEEFNILAAMQFVRWLNRRKENLAIHGVNISISLLHDMASHGCGRTPVCEACQKLIAEGTIVVAAAGNLGQVIYQMPKGENQSGFRTVNITDPGNAEDVITVGSTHRFSPHNYGISYFSSRGPTGDGRSKPDIVAPGEKIVSTIPNNGVDRMDGTSMAAPHVSGAAALLIARHRELIGHPLRVKQILCNSAVSLNREKYFQGAGLVDVLRAIQSV